MRSPTTKATLASPLGTFSIGRPTLLPLDGKGAGDGAHSHSAANVSELFEVGPVVHALAAGGSCVSRRCVPFIRARRANSGSPSTTKTRLSPAPNQYQEVSGPAWTSRGRTATRRKTAYARRLRRFRSGQPRPHADGQCGEHHRAGAARSGPVRLARARTIVTVGGPG
jgi:hypothetical protein